MSDVGLGHRFVSVTKTKEPSHLSHGPVQIAFPSLTEDASWVKAADADRTVRKMLSVSLFFFSDEPSCYIAKMIF